MAVELGGVPMGKMIGLMGLMGLMGLGLLGMMGLMGLMGMWVGRATRCRYESNWRIRS
jgi:hypothetical protein